jgi:hypothetical protein
MLSPHFLRTVSAALLVVMGAGCAATPDGRLAQAQGTGIGMLLGAGAGALVGAATGGRNGVARGALIGAAVGGAGGFAYGTHIAKRKSEYASREAWLDACIAQAHRVNANAYAYSRSLESRIARLETRARAARASRNRSEARAVKSEIAQLKVQAKQQTVEVDKELGAQQQAVNEGRGARNYGGLKNEVNSLHETKGTLGRQINRLAGLENQLDV